ncbi:hypothetical protein BDN72DRAFT_782129, partial [Pluteus cervinus]
PRNLHSGMRGNVSTYPLNVDQISKMTSGDLLPHAPSLLTAVIGVMFVGPRGHKLPCLPQMFQVRRQRVRDALKWLCANNPLYEHITISNVHLDALPEDGVPNELVCTAKLSEDMDQLDKEHETYVPDTTPDNQDENEILEDGEDGSDVEAEVLCLRPHGVVNLSGTNVPNEELMASALRNAAAPLDGADDYQVCHGSSFVNEYPRINEETGKRSNGGFENPNHLLGAFPVLFPYGAGGFEVERSHLVSYERHAQWALRYADQRFRKDLYFVFQVFNILQKRQVCRKVRLHIQKDSYNQNANLLRSLSAQDLTKAAEEEAAKKPFSNPAVKALRANLKAVRGKVTGTDESKVKLCSKIWSAVAMFGPPSIWLTINPADTSDPIAFKMADGTIDLDNFTMIGLPSGSEQVSSVTEDPFISAQYLHYVINVILQDMLGLSRNSSGHFCRKEGILGLVQAYIGSVEAQGRGSLHVHLLLILAHTPSADKLRIALLSEEFRQCLTKYISLVIKGDLDEETPDVTLAVPKTVNPALSRPLDPREPGFALASKERVKTLARSVQVHQCTLSTCLRELRGKLKCKRRAPFPLARTDWVDEAGNCGPKRIYGYVNNFNEFLMLAICANHDLKLVTNGEDTRDLAWYMSNYALKNCRASNNISSLLAVRLLFEEKHNHPYQQKCRDTNARLLTQCVNTLSRQQELSRPEVVSLLMGWGDHFLSHRYVPIFLNGIAGFLKRSFPHIRSTFARDTEVR